MTRSQKSKFVFSAWCLISLIVYAGIAWLLTSDLQTVKKLYVELAFFVLLILFSWLFNRRKKPIVLTDEERRQPLTPYAEFNNSFDWWIWGAGMVNCMLTLALTSYFWFWTLLTDCVLLGVFALLTALGLLYTMRNKYIIDGDVLVVKEYDFFRLTTDLRIPLASISSVYLCDTFTLIPHVLISVDGIERKLRCTTHTADLAVRLTLSRLH